MSKRRALPAASVAVFMTIAGAQAIGAGRPEGQVSGTQDVPVKARVFVQDNYFEPRSTDVLEGGQVTWKWRGMNRHNIRFTKVPDGVTRKGATIRSEGRWKRKFTRPGVYRYVCKVWSGMRGSVTVRPEPPPPLPES